MRSARVAIAAIAAIAACYAPSAETGAPCSPTGACPSGQSCDVSLSPPTCVGAGGGGGLDGSGSSRDGGGGDGGGGRDGSGFASPDAGSAGGCGSDADCASNACSQWTSQCIATADVLYVATDGADTGSCTTGAPCASVSYALTQIDATRRTIKLAPGSYSQSFEVDGGLGNSTDTVVILGDTGATSELDGGTGINISSADVRIEDLTVSGAANGVQVKGAVTAVLSGLSIESAMDDGVRQEDNNATANVTVAWCWIEGAVQHGIRMRGGTLTVEGTVVLHNANGGLVVNANGAGSAAVSVVNTVIVQNGTASSSAGGVQLSGAASFSQFSFNTVADNTSSGATPGGIDCGATANSGAPAIDDTIVTGNAGAQTNCTAAYSLFDDATTHGGNNNLSGDPAYADEDNGDYHITSASVARSAADPAATLDWDIDGEGRPQGPARDIGCDEIP